MIYHMNAKAKEMVSARINLGLLTSITGMLKEHSNVGNHKLMALQVMMQAEQQGIPNLDNATFDECIEKEIEFVCPAFIVVDVLMTILNAMDDAEQVGDKGKTSAFRALAGAWAPLALAAADHMDVLPPEFGPTDIRPSSLN
jgi:hypothetical protein